MEVALSMSVGAERAEYHNTMSSAAEDYPSIAVDLRLAQRSDVTIAVHTIR